MKTTNEQKGSVQNSQDRTETGQKPDSTSGVPLTGLEASNSLSEHRSAPKIIRSLPRDHVDYWRPRLKKRSYRSGPNLVEVPEWQIRLFHTGREEWFNLGTANRDAAAVKARDISVHLNAHGWETTLAKFKPQGEEKPDATAGEFLDQVKAVSGLKPVTYEIYAKKFRSLVAGVFNIDGGTAKHDYVNGGYQEWLEKIRAVRLAKLTPDKVNEWKVRELKIASSNPLRLKRAQVTLRSILLSSKALFTPEIRKHLTLRLPSPLPFEGVELPPNGKSRYKSEINPGLLLQQAKRELAEGWQGEGQPLNPRPELFKVVLLALGAGLRRDEIDTLQWRQVQWHRNAITIETTEHGGTKSAESEADVDVDPGLLDILKSYLPKPGEGSPFLIQSAVAPRPGATSYHHYRCQKVFKELIGWLRSKGIAARNALHSLRKEFGSQVCREAGIYAASVALRHSSINLTREYYIDKKAPAVFQISKYFQAGEEVPANPIPKAG